MKLKKFIIFLSVCLTVLSVCSCKKENYLVSYVSELRYNVYYADYNGVTLTANLLKKENPAVADGKVGNVYCSIMIKMPLDTEGNFKVEYSANGQPFTTDFTDDLFSPQKIATIPVDGFDENSFCVTIIEGSSRTDLTFNSIVPEKTLSYTQILDKFTEQQPRLIEQKTVDGKFNAEINMRILVRENKPYWYFAVVDEGGTKAMLFDGFTGEILSVKDIF